MKVTASSNNGSDCESPITVTERKLLLALSFVAFAFVAYFNLTFWVQEILRPPEIVFSSHGSSLPAGIHLITGIIFLSLIWSKSLTSTGVIALLYLVIILVSWPIRIEAMIEPAIRERSTLLESLLKIVDPIDWLAIAYCLAILTVVALAKWRSRSIRINK